MPVISLAKVDLFGSTKNYNLGSAIMVNHMQISPQQREELLQIEDEEGERVRVYQESV